MDGMPLEFTRRLVFSGSVSLLLQILTLTKKLIMLQIYHPIISSDDEKQALFGAIFQLKDLEWLRLPAEVLNN